MHDAKDTAEAQIPERWKGYRTIKELYLIKELEECLAVVRGERCLEDLYGIGDGPCRGCVKCLKEELGQAEAENRELRAQNEEMKTTLARLKELHGGL